MAEEHITTTHSPDGQTTHTTVTTDAPRSGGGWMIGVVLVIALAFGFYFFAIQSDSEAVKDNAIAEAANDVGNAAQTAGDAVKDAADSLKKE